MKKFLFLFALLWSVSAFSAAYTSTQSGLFSAGTTWVGGTAPSLSGDTWTIATGHTVIYDVNNLLSIGWGASTVTGTLTMGNGATAGGPVYLLMNGNLSGAGSWNVGTNGTPITYTASNTANVYIQFTNTAQCTMTKTGGLNWYGTPHLTNEYLSATAQIGATSITLSNVPSWLAANDVFWLQPTNTTIGQGGAYFMVASVIGNTITVVTSYPTGLTNNWPGIAFKSSVPTASRPPGTMVQFMGCSVEVLQPQQLSTSVCTSSASNVISGVQFQNLGKGFATSASCSGWAVSYCTANICNNGALANTGCNGFTVNYCSVIGCNVGGLANDTCFGWVFGYCTVINCANGGLSYNDCNGCIASNCIGYNCTNGVMGYNNCYGWVVIYCTVVNCGGGGLGYYCFGWTVNYCTANNCGSGGLGGGCSGWTVANCTNLNSSPLFIQCNLMQSEGGMTSTNDTLITGCSPYTLIQYDTLKWESIAGVVSNSGGTNIHICTGPSNTPVPLCIAFSVRPNAYRNIFISTQATNNVQYIAATTLGPAAPPILNLINSGNNSGAWTNTTLLFSNATSYPELASVWLASEGGISSNGYSNVTIGQDFVVQKY